MAETFKTYPMAERRNLVKLADFGRWPGTGFSAQAFLNCLPDIHAGKTLKQVVSALIQARLAGRPVILGMGAHVIKCGLAPFLIPMLERKAVTALALNGAGAIHDFELAYYGETSEDVSAELASGRFGFVEETGAWMGEAICAGHQQRLGMGEALYSYMNQHPEQFPHREHSLLWHSGRLGIPCTVHVAIGTDFIHLHPAVTGEAIGSTTFQDFLLFCDRVRALERGVYWNLGSAVVLPEVFLKAVSRAHNLGEHLEGMTTINMDMLMPYRAITNVVRRPSIGVGEGFHITGHHEIMVPLVTTAFLEGLESC
jgi:hypothetical protein